MKTAIVLPLILAAAAPALAASPFDGTWKADLSTATLSDKPDTMLLENGVYTCKTCLPPYTVPADGKFHPIAGHAYADAAAIRIVDPHTVTMTYRKGGKVNFTETDTVLADGKTLRVAAKGDNAATGVAFTSVSTSTRVAPAPAGAHAISGSWLQSHVQSASDSGLKVTIATTATTMTMTAGTGESYTATYGGPPVMQANDPGKTMVSLRRLAPDHVIETDMRDGKTVGIADMTVSKDGRTITNAWSDPRDGSKGSAKFLKQ